MIREMSEKRLKSGNVWVGGPGYCIEILKNPWYRALSELQEHDQRIDGGFLAATGGGELFIYQ
jgi:hypothetical protein